MELYAERESTDWHPEAETMRRIMADNPDLTDFGIGIYMYDGQQLRTEKERAETFERDRDQLLHPRSLDVVKRNFAKE